MALRKLSSLLLVVVGGASAIVARGTQLYTTGYFPQIDCSPAPMATSTGSNGTAFRANLLTLLASLPDQAAPTGFASMQAGAGGRAPWRRDDDRAVLAQCAAGRAPADCVQCLQDSARAMPRCCWNAWGLGESVAVALSYDCVLQFTMHLASPAASLGGGALRPFALAVGAAALAIIM
uniref:Gnk2-homologous domain-containing protein n=1 Tax=Oryza barthii TaxID=65489 RepID=A0A0D3EUP4_9ORYZ